MPDKPKHSKGKHHQSKKSKAIQRMASTQEATPGPAMDIPATQAAVAHAPAEAARAAAPAKTKAPQYPYFTSEIRRITILAVIILVVLVILARVLS